MAEKESLEDILTDISPFIKLVDGQSFEGIYTQAKKVISRFDPDSETIELWFDINGKDKSISGVRLGQELVRVGVKVGDSVKITRVSTKGTKVEWKVEKK